MERGIGQVSSGFFWKGKCWSGRTFIINPIKRLALCRNAGCFFIALKGGVKNAEVWHLHNSRRKDRWRIYQGYADCVEDIIALALNNLPPCYSTTIRGKVFLTSTYKQPEKVDMIHRAIIDAIAIVSRNPRHNEERIHRPMLWRIADKPTPNHQASDTPIWGPVVFLSFPGASRQAPPYHLKSRHEERACFF